MKDKTDITGTSFEPWHYRYVGVEDAQKITAQGVCLEEYLGAGFCKTGRKLWSERYPGYEKRGYCGSI